MTSNNERPNVLLLQADQLAAAALGAYGNQVVQSPNIDQLGADGVVFERAYCNSPLCAPSRASMMTGMLPSDIGAYDNAADFGASIPTFAHHLRNSGYHTALIGRMHFIGPDQLHGFEERHTTDVYPASLDMVPNWDLPTRERLDWYHNTESVVTAGASIATVQRDYDDEVAFRTLRHLTDRARQTDPSPFLLVSSFIHPHDPYEPPIEFWNQYEGVEIDEPNIDALPEQQHDPHSLRLLQMCGFDRRKPTREETRNARRAYYASISYVDAHIGRIMERLEQLGLRENTVVIITSDHGDMLGERGLWYKMSPFEQSARVPLIVNAPGLFTPHRVAQPVSLIDLLPTLVDLAQAPPANTPGQSVVNLAQGQTEPDRDIFIEYLAEGVSAPQITLVRDHYKVVICPGDPDQLYDLANDPFELKNLADSDRFADTLAELKTAIMSRYDFAGLARRTLDSQSRRRFVHSALSAGASAAWDYEVRAVDHYVRGDFWKSLEDGRIPAIQAPSSAAISAGLHPENGRAVIDQNNGNNRREQQERDKQVQIHS